MISLAVSHMITSPSPPQVNTFCKLLSDFAMEYRTTYDKVQAKRERIKHEKEREKKRGKLIVSAQAPQLVFFAVCVCVCVCVCVSVPAITYSAARLCRVSFETWPGKVKRKIRRQERKTPRVVYVGRRWTLMQLTSWLCWPTRS